MESTPKNHKLEYDLNLNTPSPKRSRRELSLKEKFDLIQARWIPFTVPHWNTQWRRKWPGCWHSVGTADPCGSSRGRLKWTDFIWGNVWYRGVRAYRGNIWRRVGEGPRGTKNERIPKSANVKVTMKVMT